MARRIVFWVLGGLSAIVGVFILLGIAFVLFGPTVNTPLRRPAVEPPLAMLRERVTLPPGFEIDYFVQGLRSARFMRFAPSGDLWVTLRSGSLVLVERDADGDGRADGVRTLLEGLREPHGLDVWDGWLYLAETHRVTRVRFDPATGALSGTPEPVVEGLPSDGGHSTRTVRFGPDRRMYVTVGSSCNVCDEEDPRRAAMLRYAPDGSDYTLFATGLRNSVGFDFHPETGEIYATDNGRDLLGDDFPPCELNRVVQGGFYGWPIANGDRVPDPDEGEAQGARIAESVPPVHGFGAHTAPLGITFYTGTAFPEEWRGRAFVALHGSWNRSKKAGYRVVAVALGEDGEPARESDFAVGFERNEDVIGRPVDVAVGPDGALYVTDDFLGAIYRIRYVGEGASDGAAAGS